MSNFNHFMPEAYNITECPGVDKHAWLPTSQTKRLASDIAVQVYCKHCKSREWSVMIESEFRLAQKQWEILK
jgi:hypothetical protein